MRWLLATLLALTWMASTFNTVRAAEPSTVRAALPEIWFNGFSRGDWLKLWNDDAPWKLAASRTNVIAIASWWLTVVPDDQILAVFNFAKRHHIKVAMEEAMVARYATDTCGVDEGHSPPEVVTAQMAVLTRLKLHIDILTMDEPIWFGHYAADPSSCRHSIPDLVDRVAANYNIIVAQSPDIQLVEIETIPGVTNFPDWRDTISSFQDLLAQKIGKRVHAIQSDVGWDNPNWTQAMQEMQSFAHQRNMGFGFYMYGGGFDQSDAQWTNHALKHMETAEGALGIIPDQAIFASWSPFPVNAMPETQPYTLTWLVNRYFRTRTTMQGQFVGQGVKGRLTTIQGKPIANETVNAYVPGVNFNLPLPTTVIQNAVPPQAAYGLIGYRLNLECGCAGLNDVLVGKLQYQEIQGGSKSASYVLPFFRQNYGGVIVDAEWVGGVQVNRVIATATQVFPPNSSFFPVTPGATFTFTIPASTIGGDGWYGHVMLLFFDKNFNSLNGGAFVIPEADRRLMSTATTAADGTFTLRKLPRVGPGLAQVTVEFPGDDNYRAVTWTPRR
jgi:hypothetical protein